MRAPANSFAGALQEASKARITTLAQLRDTVIRRSVLMEIKSYQKGVRTRRCAWCGHAFKPRQRYHFLAHEECRKNWYRGQFRPKEVK